MKTSTTIHIMENDFQLACEVGEREILNKSAELLNTSLRDFRQKNPGLDIEKTIIMGALRTVCELMAENKANSEQITLANKEIENSLNQIKSLS